MNAQLLFRGSEEKPCTGDEQGRSFIEKIVSPRGVVFHCIPSKFIVGARNVEISNRNTLR